MLSEARARLANTQGKKAKRKARERQLEESRRLAMLQKRRELKNAGINIKIVNRKKGQMDYNADIPFEKPAAPGFYDTQEEQRRNEHQRETFDPRKQLANKRKGDQGEDEDRKRYKQGDSKSSAASAAAAKAGQMQKIREAEQQSKRKTLVLPSPQVSEGELEDIVKMGMAGDRAAKMAGDENDGTKGLIANYNNMVGSTPIRTPRAPAQEDHIANEIKNIKALTETRSSLLGGDNTPLQEGSASTGFDGIAPRKQAMVTPNPLATPFRNGSNGVGATPARQDGLAGATPLRTPRDNFAINESGSRQLVGQTPREIRDAEQLRRQSLRAKLSSLPRPKEQDLELEEQLPPPTSSESIDGDVKTRKTTQEEDAAEVDRRNAELERQAAEADFKRQTQVFQRSLPHPKQVDYGRLKQEAEAIDDPIESLIAQEAALLIATDAIKLSGPNAVQGYDLASRSTSHPSSNSRSTSIPSLSSLSDDLSDSLLASARAAIDAETSPEALSEYTRDFLSQSSNTTEMEMENEASKLSTLLTNTTSSHLLPLATSASTLEKRLSLHLGGYQARAKLMRSKIVDVAEEIEKKRNELEAYRVLETAEHEQIGGISGGGGGDHVQGGRLDRLRDEVERVCRRERMGQEIIRGLRDERREVG